MCEPSCFPCKSLSFLVLVLLSYFGQWYKHFKYVLFVPALALEVGVDIVELFDGLSIGHGNFRFASKIQYYSR